jgi:predicted nucleic acid-binding protein
MPRHVGLRDNADEPPVLLDDRQAPDLVLRHEPQRLVDVTDAHVVALMVENGVRTISTHDRDRRFSEIETRDPFE